MNPLTKEDILLVSKWFKKDGKLFWMHCYGLMKHLHYRNRNK